MAAQIIFINAAFGFSLAALAVFSAGYVFDRPRLAAKTERYTGGSETGRGEVPR